MRPDRVPAVRDAPARRSLERDRGLVQPVVDADERVARGVEAGDLARAPEHRVVVAPLAVLGGVVDRRALDLDLADRVRALEVRHVVQRLVEAELDVREEPELLPLAAPVADGRLPDLGVLADGDEEQELDLDPVLLADDARVAEAVPALVPVERRLRRLPARVPDRVAVADVEVAAAEVVRHVVVAIARQPAEPGVAPERVAAGRVRAEPVEIVLPEVVEPGERRVGTRRRRTRAPRRRNGHTCFSPISRGVRRCDNPSDRRVSQFVVRCRDLRHPPPSTCAARPGSHGPDSAAFRTGPRSTSSRSTPAV